VMSHNETLIPHIFLIKLWIPIGYINFASTGGTVALVFGLGKS